MSGGKNSIKYSVFSYSFRFGFQPLFLEQICFILSFLYSDYLQLLQTYLVIAKRNMIRNIKGQFSLVAPESAVSVVGVVAGVIVGTSVEVKRLVVTGVSDVGVVVGVIVGTSVEVKGLVVTGVTVVEVVGSFVGSFVGLVVGFVVEI